MTGWRGACVAGFVVAAASVALAAASCAQVIGLDQFHDGVCNPGAKRACYEGPADTDGVGICQRGAQICEPDGKAWGKCVGATLPSPKEDCENNVDDDCNGVVNDTCSCIAGTTMPCYSGAPGTEGKGICHGGTQTCNEDGTGYGECVGEQTPLAEDCSTKQDDNCDGQVNEAAASCQCIPGETRPCYTGSGTTENVGLCVGGMQACNPDGVGYGPCMGEVTPAAEDCSNATDEDCDGFACSRTLWAKQFGTGSYQKSHRVAVSAPAGEIYVGGRFYGAMQFGNDVLIDGGNSDAFLAKLDAGGTPIWAKRFGGAGIPGEAILSLALDAAGSVVVLSQGDLGGASNVMKLDATGTPIWSKACGSTTGNNADAVDLAVDEHGDVVIAGQFSGTITCVGASATSAGGYDVFVAKLSGVDGSLMWFHRYGSTGEQSARKIATDKSGNIYVTGRFSETFSFGPSNFVLAQGSYDVYVARFTPEGVVSLTRTLGDDQYQDVTALAVDSAGSIILGGGNRGTITLHPGTVSTTASGQFSGYTVKLDASGNGVWAQEMLAPESLAAGVDGKISVVATLYGSNIIASMPLTASGASDVIVAKLEPTDGSLVWHRQFGNTDAVAGTSIAVGSMGEPVVTGTFKGAFAFDSVMLSATGTNTNIFIAKIAP